MNVEFPYRFNQLGRTAEVDDEGHIRDMIEQLLFTAPGERVNRPTFGSGLLQLVFAPNRAELAATVQTLTQGALQQWLGDLIQVEAVEAESRDASLHVTVRYQVLRTGEARQAEFTREGGTP